MANTNFTVHNGLTVGPTTIDAASGNITLGGSIITTGSSGFPVTAPAGGNGYGTIYANNYAGNISAYVVADNTFVHIGSLTNTQLNLKVNGTTPAFIGTSGNLVVTTATTSTNTTTGAIVAPSIGIIGNVNANAYYSNYYLYSNGNPITTPAGGANTMVQFNDGSNFNGATYLQYNKTSGNLVSNSLTNSTSSTTGALVIAGGIGVAQDLYLSLIHI